MRKKILLSALISICLLTIACNYIMGVPSSGEEETPTPACTQLPEGFSESDLVGTWVGDYFGNIDTLIIRADHKYKQIYKSYTPGHLNFESGWQNWWLDEKTNGFARLHLEGLRRCDGIESTCNFPGGGLPSGETPINPCDGEYTEFPGHEIILYVTGAKGDVPRGFLLRQARLAGSDWTFNYSIQK
jgi:hypothetical protein